MTALEVPFNMDDAVWMNDAYRDVLWTTPHFQIVAMSLRGNETIPREVHPFQVQVFRVFKGSMDLTTEVNGESHTTTYRAGDHVVILPGTIHTVVPHGRKAVRLWTLYTPPVHAPHTYHERQPTEAVDAASELSSAPASAGRRKKYIFTPLPTGQ